MFSRISPSNRCSCGSEEQHKLTPHEQPYSQPGGRRHFDFIWNDCVYDVSSVSFGQTFGNSLPGVTPPSEEAGGGNHPL